MHINAPRASRRKISHRLHKTDGRHTVGQPGLPHKTHHSVARLIRVGAELLEDCRGSTAALSCEAEQDVLGADDLVVELVRFTQCSFERLTRMATQRGDRMRRARTTASHLALQDLTG